MNWSVIWIPSVENDLANLWITSPDREEVASAADSLDAMLQRDPYAQSESRSGSTRIMFAPPLGISYDVIDSERRVVVEAIWRFRT